MKKIFYALLVVSVIFSACKKEEEEPTSTTTNTNNNNNNGGNNNTNSEILGTWDLIEYTVYSEEGYYTDYPDPDSRYVEMGDIQTYPTYNLGFEDYSLRFASNDTLEEIFTLFGGNQYSNLGSWDLNGVDLTMDLSQLQGHEYTTITELTNSNLKYSLGLNETTWNKSSGSSSSFVNCAVYVSDGGFPSEISWQIVNQGGSTVWQGVTGTEILPLTDGECYQMQMIDSYGDGWNGAEYTITNTDDNIILSTGTLTNGSMGTEDFCVTTSGGGGGNDTLTYFTATETIYQYYKAGFAPGISNARIQKENKAIIEEKNK